MCDGIWGRDFLQRKEAQLCYRTRALVFQKGGRRTENKLLSDPASQRTTGKPLSLPKRSEVKLPVTAGSSHNEEVINKKETQEGVSLASSLTKIIEGQMLKRILNMTGNNTRTGDWRTCRRDRAGRQGFFIAECCCNERGQRPKILEKLRREHLKKEERQCTEKTYFDDRDAFYLPGDKISCTNAVKHAINLVTGTIPINVIPYRLPESQI
jgi:hypothetical protein